MLIGLAPLPLASRVDHAGSPGWHHSARTYQDSHVLYTVGLNPVGECLNCRWPGLRNRATSIPGAVASPTGIRTGTLPYRVPRAGLDFRSKGGYWCGSVEANLGDQAAAIIRMGPSNRSAGTVHGSSAPLVSQSSFSEGVGLSCSATVTLASLSHVCYESCCNSPTQQA